MPPNYIHERNKIVSATAHAASATTDDITTISTATFTTDILLFNI